MRLVKGYRNAEGGFTPPIEGYGRFGDAGDGEPAMDRHAAPPDPSSDLPPEYQGDAVFLSGFVQLGPKGNASVNNEALRNPYDFPIEIHEFRFTVIGLQGLISGASYVGYYTSPAAQINVGLALENDSGIITKNKVPIYLLCPGQLLNSESVSFVGAPSSGVVYCAASYRVALRHPLVLKPRELLRCSFENLSLITGGTQVQGVAPGAVTAYAAYLCRTRRDLQLGRTRILPYFAAWTPSALVQPASGAPDVQYSQETDLINQTEEPVTLSRFVGRCAISTYATAAGQQNSALSEFTDSLLAIGSGVNCPGPDVLQVLMNRSNGVPIIAPGTPFRMAFDAFTRAWEIGEAGLVLEPNDYFKAQLSLVPPASGIDQSTAQMYASIGMAGFREVQL